MELREIVRPDTGDDPRDLFIIRKLIRFYSRRLRLAGSSIFLV